ncbi:EamA family transporter [Desulfosporosinus sp.]|uniref:EamA family transporter n=1 Tax=Desulfosporosinus sp. TaxID=157907 RepID=UPI000E9AA291|nr:EamA family transporter [Desulfosporosinus sp.]MBC2721489.1 EamA family transporter [Desulfosporosinus sp.]MBC2726364.1 EamA family transporter [Desulfosporosinus sp.]HBV86869.1 transporter [Desulfosporosinus sp.]
MLVLLTIFNSMLMVAGQTLWKLGASGKEVHSLGQLLRLFLGPYVILGLVVYAFASVLWIYILNKGELSYLYPIQSTAFIFALFIGTTFFKEELTATKIIGVLVICLGVIIITRK